ncbi:hypothetical protein [Saccharopolyspora hattusasensis]|uniref:hypothetical protein n=1 Tax=Saccharopolyspora hattusasensis TaxID=1128679 RepID=UPI003D984998
MSNPATAAGQQQLPLFLAAVAFGWLTSILARTLVRLAAFDQAQLDQEELSMPQHRRPRPVRSAASIVGGLTAVISGLVGSGLITGLQGDAITGVISAVVAAAGAFGFAIATEPKVTPTADPYDDQGRPLAPAEPPVANGVGRPAETNK